MVKFLPFGYDWKKKAALYIADVVVDGRGWHDPPTKEELDSVRDKVNGRLTAMQAGYQRDLTVAIGCKHGKSRSVKACETLRREYDGKQTDHFP